jgi:hypothetical protein
MKNRRYLVDENTSPSIADQLRRLQPKITIHTVGDEIAPPKGTADPEILCWIEKNGYSLITRNRKSMPQHLKNHLKAGHHVLGIFVIRPKATMREVIDDLLLIWEAAEMSEYQDQIVHIPLSQKVV